MVPCYKINEKSITRYTNHFCDIVCSCEEKLCHKSLVILPFGKLTNYEQQTEANVKVFLCHYLYNLTENQEVRINGLFTLWRQRQRKTLFFSRCHCDHNVNATTCCHDIHYFCCCYHRIEPIHDSNSNETKN